ncbi:DUF6408 family protein [Streptomyces sp. 900105755]
MVDPSRGPHFGEGGCPVGRSLPFRTHNLEWPLMEPVEYKPARRPWIREILAGAAASLISNLVWEALAVAARHLI